MARVKLMVKDKLEKRKMFCITDLQMSELKTFHGYVSTIKPKHLASIFIECAKKFPGKFIHQSQMAVITSMDEKLIGDMMHDTRRFLLKSTHRQLHNMRMIGYRSEANVTGAEDAIKEVCKKILRCMNHVFTAAELNGASGIEYNSVGESFGNLKTKLSDVLQEMSSVLAHYRQEIYEITDEIEKDIHTEQALEVAMPEMIL